jgi:hypothetical protein
VSDEQFASKRERQKARRSERLEREAQQAAAAQRRQRGVYALVALVVLALIGTLVYRQIAENRAERAEEIAVEGRLDELGCTEDVQMPDLGGGHITEQSIPAEDPGIIYTGSEELPGEPPSSGRHLPQVVPSGVFDVAVDPRLTTHNLEHGYIVAWYSPEAPAEEVEALKAWGREAREGDFPKVVVAEYHTALPDGKNVALTAWFQRQMCDTFDPSVANVFARRHYDLEGEGPEKGIPSHEVGAQGVVPVEDEPVFLPPLSDEAGTDSAADEASEAGEAPDPASEGEASEADATEAEATEPEATEPTG